MSAPTGWYERDDRFIPVHHQPACLLDLALARDIDSHRLLRGTGLFYDTLQAQERHISASQFLRLISNTQEALAVADTSFQFGQRLLPGHYGPASNALAHASHLQQALTALVDYRVRLSPLLAPRLWLDEQHLCLYWLDACGAAGLRRFLVEAGMSAVVAMARWQSGERLPWRFLFSHDRPAHLEHYHAHLGTDLHFGCQVDAMVLPREYAVSPWPRAAQTVALLARRDAEQELAGLGFTGGFVDRVYQELFAELRQGGGLDELAGRLAMSPATCKRKLKAHGSSFQALHDSVRKHVALYLYWGRGYSSEAVAHYLGFHDTTNFRRSFKRWTGQLPSVLRRYLAKAEALSP